MRDADCKTNGNGTYEDLLCKSRAFDVISGDEDAHGLDSHLNRQVLVRMDVIVGRRIANDDALSHRNGSESGEEEDGIQEFHCRNKPWGMSERRS